MEEDPEITQNSEKIVTTSDLHDENGKFKKGHPKVGGKTLGTNDFATDFDEAVEEIAKDNGMTKSEARKLLLKVAYKNAKDGNYSFYKDIHDRIYGTATNKTDLNVKGEINIQISEAIAKKNE
jgi:hypothetical protein